MQSVTTSDDSAAAPPSTSSGAGEAPTARPTWQKAVALGLLLLALLAVAKPRNWSMPHNALKFAHSTWASLRGGVSGVAGGDGTGEGEGEGEGDMWLPTPVTRRAVVFVISPNYLRFAYATMRALRTTGGYDGDIVVVTEAGEMQATLARFVDCASQDFLTKDEKRQEMEEGCVSPRYGAKVVGYPAINLTAVSAFHAAHPFTRGDGRHTTKTFQWHKLYIFHTWFKENYDRVLYLDAGFQLGGDLSDLWLANTHGALVAPWDDPRLVWKLDSQIEKQCCPEVYADLEKTVGDLHIDHFQTGAVLFDTELITPDTLPTLLQLMDRWPIMLTNEQALMNVYFSAMLQQWIPMQTYARSKDWSVYEYCADPRGITESGQYTLLWKYKCGDS